jgi:cytoplasmic iron level regulating protein YaaA (DUF328/UPF0246 family)
LPELDAARVEVLEALGPDHPAAIEPTMPAIERYTGVLYRELDAATLPPAARRRLDRRVLIASGLWGLSAPRDPIPHYRLKMSASVAPLGRLSTWWRPRLTEALAPRVRGAVVWDLLPNEHAAALDWRALAPKRRITVRFVDRDERTVSHWNKLLKGSLVRWQVSTDGGVDDLEGFEHPQGYRLDPAATTVDGAHIGVVLRPVDG